MALFYSPTILRVKVKFAPKKSRLRPSEMPRVHSSVDRFRLDRLNPTVAEDPRFDTRAGSSREALD